MTRRSKGNQEEETEIYLPEEDARWFDGPMEDDDGVNADADPKVRISIWQSP